MCVHVQHSLFALGFSWGGAHAQHVQQQHADAIIISDDDANRAKEGFMSYVPKGHMNDTLRNGYRKNTILIDAAKEGPSQFVMTAGRWMQIKQREMREERGEGNEHVSPLIAALIASMFGRDSEGVFQGRHSMERETLKRQAVQDGGVIQTVDEGVTLIVTRNGVYVDDSDYRDKLEKMGEKLHKQCFPQGA